MALSVNQERFVDLWGSMGVFWGINRSMARIHAYILLSPHPVTLDEVVAQLTISKGNASMSLNELRHWGVIHRSHQRGDRRDYYTAEPDTWTMLFQIAKERKRREFDPALDALRDLLGEGECDATPEVAERLQELEKLMSLGDRVAGKLLVDVKKSRSVLTFVKLFLAE
ncbi:MAG TPA: transcriptional regulator [Candidatus Aminicenantes bacterium]|nr:transcriptional regulator [Candidatus Aminicenantes bacterium]